MRLQMAKAIVKCAIMTSAPKPAPNLFLLLLLMTLTPAVMTVLMDKEDGLRAIGPEFIEIVKSSRR